jgi:NAD(P)-dependent dehydrogenase (short-subunit alcohol dehydrogenase family)
MCTTPQQQEKHPGCEREMVPAPAYMAPNYKGSGKLKDKVALVTGGDSGIGRSVSILFAREGAKVAIVYLDQDKDAEKTKKLVEAEGSNCLLIRGDISNSSFCNSTVEQTVKQFGQLDILINNAAQQYPQKSIADITDEQLDKTFRVNIYSMFYMTRAALKYLSQSKSGCIINSTSVTAYKGHEVLVDYASTKGAITAFTYSLSQQLAEQGIRVNAVAPGPIWTPLIPSSFSEERVAKFGKNTAMGRPGQPEEVAPSYVFLASEADSSYITGQVLHPNGGTVISG